ncbi:MAG: hypothetical protein ABIZ34_00155 [Candidatus Limnocylindrales bacterium]
MSRKRGASIIQLTVLFMALSATIATTSFVVARPPSLVTVATRQAPGSGRATQDAGRHQGGRIAQRLPSINGAR